MYCATCELEIKGDDKETCPVCGAPLFDSHDDGSDLIIQDRQRHSSIEDIVEDINSLIESEGEPEMAAGSEEEVFVLRDYAPDSPDVDGVAPVNGGAEDLQGRESVSDMLDSIRQSIAMPEHDEEEPVATGSDRSGSDEDFGLFDSNKPDFSDFSDLGTMSDTSPELAWGFDDAADALPVPDAPARKRSPAFMIILIIVLCAVGGYYVLNLPSDNAGRDDQARTVRTVMPLVESQVDAQQKQSVEEKLSTPAAEVSVPAGQAQLPALVNEDALLSAQVDSQQPASEKPVGTVVSPAPPATEALSASAPAAAKADASVKSEPVPAEVVKPVKTPVTVEPEALPASAKVVAEEAVLEQSKPASAEVVKPAVSAAPVRAPFYTVHVGSYRTKAVASAEAERIKAKGHDVFVERADLGRRGTWYRVKVGRFKVKSDAEQLMKKIHKVLVQDSVVVRNLTD